MFLFDFNRLITPTYIKLIFYLLVIVGVIAAFGAASSAAQYLSYVGGGFTGLVWVLAIVAVLVEIVLLRVAAELVLVVFMIRSELAWQRENTLKIAAGD